MVSLGINFNKAKVLAIYVSTPDSGDAHNASATIDRFICLISNIITIIQNYIRLLYLGGGGGVNTLYAMGFEDKLVIPCAFSAFEW